MPYRRRPGGIDFLSNSDPNGLSDGVKTPTTQNIAPRHNPLSQTRKGNGANYEVHKTQQEREARQTSLRVLHGP